MYAGDVDLFERKERRKKEKKVGLGAVAYLVRNRSPKYMSVFSAMLSFVMVE